LPVAKYSALAESELTACVECLERCRRLRAIATSANSRGWNSSGSSQRVYEARFRLPGLAAYSESRPLTRRARSLSFQNASPMFSWNVGLLIARARAPSKGGGPGLAPPSRRTMVNGSRDMHGKCGLGGWPRPHLFCRRSPVQHQREYLLFAFCSLTM
jgi:hypothetical protein